jgi:hypothetical protein
LFVRSAPFVSDRRAPSLMPRIAWGMCSGWGPEIRSWFHCPSLLITVSLSLIVPPRPRGCHPSVAHVPAWACPCIMSVDRYKVSEGGRGLAHANVHHRLWTMGSSLHLSDLHFTTLGVPGTPNRERLGSCFQHTVGTDVAGSSRRYWPANILLSSILPRFMPHSNSFYNRVDQPS